METTKSKAVVLSMALAALTWWPESLAAQTQNGMFGRSPEQGKNEMSGMLGKNGVTRGDGMEWYGLTPQDPTQEAPLGGGLVLLMAAGAGYAALKRKEEQQ